MRVVLAKLFIFKRPPNNQHTDYFIWHFCVQFLLLNRLYSSKNSTPDSAPFIEVDNAAAVFFQLYTTAADRDCLGVSEVVEQFCMRYHAHTGRRPSLSVSVPLRGGYETVYGSTYSTIITEFPDCQWVYVPDYVSR